MAQVLLRESSKGLHERLEREADYAARSVVEGISTVGLAPLTTRGVVGALGEGLRADVSGVRIHDDARAARAAGLVDARAFTSGRDIYFGRGHYDPHTRAGRFLLAHELSHVVQQGATRAGESGVSTGPGAPSVQGSWLGNLWEGVKSVASSAWEGVKTGAAAVWSGIKTGASALWSGVKTVASGAWEAMKAIGGWGWNVLKAAAASVWDLITEAPARIWRLLKHVGSGFVDLLEGLWSGIKGAAGHVWEALKGVMRWAGEGVVGLFSWVWEGLKGGARWAWRLVQGDFSGFWEGIADMFNWLGRGAVGLAKWGWEGLSGAAVWAWEGAKGFAKWIWRGVVSGAAWVGRLIAKLADLAGFGEVWDLIWQVIKFNSRPLEAAEITEAKKVFGDTISYWQVRVDEYSLIAVIGNLFAGKSGGGMGVTTFHTINFNKKIKPSPGSGDMAWLVHELTHVWQYERVGSQYIGEALHAQATKGYDYGADNNYANNANGAALAGATAAGKKLADFNREQQGEIASHYYMRQHHGLNTADWQPFVKEFQR